MKHIFEAAAQTFGEVGHLVKGLHASRVEPAEYLLCPVRLFTNPHELGLERMSGNVLYLNLAHLLVIGARHQGDTLDIRGVPLVPGTAVLFEAFFPEYLIETECGQRKKKTPGDRQKYPARFFHPAGLLLSRRRQAILTRIARTANITIKNILVPMTNGLSD